MRSIGLRRFRLASASLLGVALLTELLASCGELREPITPEGSPTYTYLDDIQPLLQARCVSCHNRQVASGGYQLDSWSGLLGPGRDLIRNARPGDVTSELFSNLTWSVHAGLFVRQEAEMLADWIVTDRLAYFRSRYHPADWLYPGDRGSHRFHGGELRARGWDVGPCAACHGADLAGGVTGKSCLSCHPDGPVTGCTTCHGSAASGGLPVPDLSWGLDPTRARGVGAHAAHASPQTAEPLTCDECHRVPRSVDDPGHLFDTLGERSSDGRAEVRFGVRAGLHGVNPSYDRNGFTGTCSVYCHGAGFAKPGSNARPTWLVQMPMNCDSCHPTPMSGIGGADCTICHQQSVVACSPGGPGCLQVAGGVWVQFRNNQLHLDGRAPVGRAGAEGTCWACHGSKERIGGPPPDLHGNTDISDRGVGLHQTHLTDSPLRKALTCDICHLMPTELSSAGHIDSDLPAEVRFNALASGKLRDPSAPSLATWNPATATCERVYCHSRPEGKVGPSWSWTQKLAGGLVCDSCHKGHAGYSVPYCVVCHPAAFKNGEINPETHMNGQLDFLW